MTLPYNFVVKNIPYAGPQVHNIGQKIKFVYKSVPVDTSKTRASKRNQKVNSEWVT